MINATMRGARLIENTFEKLGILSIYYSGKYIPCILIAFISSIGNLNRQVKEDFTHFNAVSDLWRYLFLIYADAFVYLFL